MRNSSVLSCFSTIAIRSATNARGLQLPRRLHVALLLLSISLLLKPPSSIVRSISSKWHQSLRGGRFLSSVNALNSLLSRFCVVGNTRETSTPNETTQARDFYLYRRASFATFGIATNTQQQGYFCPSAWVCVEADGNRFLSMRMRTWNRQAQCTSNVA